MASSPYHHPAFAVFFATAIASALVSSQDSRTNPACDLITASQSLQIFRNQTRQAVDQISNASLAFVANGTLEQLILSTAPTSKLVFSALESCRQLLPMAIDNLNNSLMYSPVASDEALGDVKSWVCAAADNLQTCFDGFQDSSFKIKDLVSKLLNIHMDSLSGASIIVYEINLCSHIGLSHSRKDHFVEQYYVSGGRDYPSWISSENRELVETNNVNADIVVAKDGSGNYTTISEAIKVAPLNSNKRFVIYVKNGTYVENVKIGYNQWNVMMFGDGMNDTIVVGNLSYANGYDTFLSATFSVYGQGFIARDMGFYNNAGANKNQAVALLSTADKSVFYKCRMDGYQDTLYAKNNRQFYRECHIYGTIDFIFGSLAVIQSSTILVRKPAPGQENAVTAQSGMNKYCRGGITIQSSHIMAAEDLSGVSTFLGRQWKPYSTTVFIENTMEILINPLGWEVMEKMQGSDPPPSTIFLAEYGNQGPGAETDGRVKWSKPNISLSEASNYTVASLINGGNWLPSTGIPFTTHDLFLIK